MSSLKLPTTEALKLIEQSSEQDSEALYYEILREIGDAVVKYRKANKITSKELAAQLGVAVSVISRIESGNKNISIKTISKIFAHAGLRLSIEGGRCEK